MVIQLHRYFGNDHITKSVMEVWMDGEDSPRLTCEARESAYSDYSESFAGASHYCLPVGKWKLKVGHSPYSPMGLRVPKCPGHRQVYIGHKWVRQCYEGEILIGEAVLSEEYEGEWAHMYCTIDNGEEVFRKLDALVYEAFGRLEEFWLEVDNENIAVATTI